MVRGSDGNVGIASTSPTAALAINGAAGVHNFIVGSSTGTYFIVDILLE